MPHSQLLHNNFPSSSLTFLPTSSHPAPVSTQQYVDPGPGLSNNDTHDHWCYNCGKYTAIQKCKDFERHVKSHLIRHYCIAPDSVADAAGGPRCKKCGASNPGSKHLNGHNDEKNPECIGKYFSRIDSLIEHLRTHHKVEARSSQLKHSAHLRERPDLGCTECHLVSLDRLFTHIHDFHSQRSPDLSFFEAPQSHDVMSPALCFSEQGSAIDGVMAATPTLPSQGSYGMVSQWPLPQLASEVYQPPVGPMNPQVNPHPQPSHSFENIASFPQLQKPAHQPPTSSPWIDPPALGYQAYPVHGSRPAGPSQVVQSNFATHPPCESWAPGHGANMTNPYADRQALVHPFVNQDLTAYNWVDTNGDTVNPQRIMQGQPQNGFQNRPY